MQLKPNERDKIAVWYANNLSIRQIARRLGRNHSVVSRELKRNGYAGGYVAIHAQSLATKRSLKAKRRYPLKNEYVYKYVVSRLKRGWSPELIAGRLKKNLGKSVICWETIYNYIHSPEARDKMLWEYLTIKRKKRRLKQGRSVVRVRIPNRVSIHTRSKLIESRREFGHHEGDSIIGRQTKGKVIHTEVERKTRYLMALLLNSKSALDTVQAQKKIFTTIPALSVTTDNGTEFVQHQQLNSLGIKTYFADPYASWQRGTNENTNGLIRRYLPKKTSFEDLTQDDLDDIVWEINNRPKKVLNYSTPFEALQKELLVKGGAFPGRM